MHIRQRFEVRGTVQGVGFRPWVATLAQSLGLTGFVQNLFGVAVLEVQGPEEAVGELRRNLGEMPQPAEVRHITASALPLRQDEVHFRVEVTPTTAARPPKCEPIPNCLLPDQTWCAHCQTEYSTSLDRRFGYPFISCAQCGPRYTIAESFPYERATTAYSRYRLCPDCRREYESPTDRRFHAQTISCWHCGPRLSFTTNANCLGAGSAHETFGLDALSSAVALLCRGEILALRGVGGYQLLVRASEDEPVRRLRERKRRPHKPLAVLFESLDQLQRYCQVAPAERHLLEASEGPVVLLDTGTGLAKLSPYVAPECQRLGAMLPTTGLHHALVRGAGVPLVCTSGNVSNSPICISRPQAVENLARVADGFLDHDRAIVRGVDDSVVQVVSGTPQLLRRARGYVPRRVATVASNSCVVALGGHQKSTFALSVAGDVLMSPHIGDLDSPETVALLEDTLRSWLQMYNAVPSAVVCDQHPNYASTLLAERLASEWSVSCHYVQHHHAHVAAVIAEHSLDRPVLGLAWDGVGWGLDGALWGGEVLRCDGTTATHVGQLLPFPLIGGELAAKEPRRSALGLLHAANLPLPDAWHAGLSAAELDRLGRFLNVGLQSPMTTSIGRLFDGFSALFGGVLFNRYEGDAAQQWMALAERDWDSQESAPPYPYVLDSQGTFDWRPMLKEALTEHPSCPTHHISRRFHATLAEVAISYANLHPDAELVVSGGCFQNRLLLTMLHQAADRVGVRVYSAKNIPPNDACLSLGQLWLAARTIEAPRAMSF